MNVHFSNEFHVIWVSTIEKILLTEMRHKFVSLISTNSSSFLVPFRYPLVTQNVPYICKDEIASNKFKVPFVVGQSCEQYT